MKIRYFQAKCSLLMLVGGVGCGVGVGGGGSGFGSPPPGVPPPSSGPTFFILF